MKNNKNTIIVKGTYANWYNDFVAKVLVITLCLMMEMELVKMFLAS